MSHPVTQFEVIHTRDDGSQAKITAKQWFNSSLDPYTDTVVLWRQNEGANWEYCSFDDHDKNIKTMSREDYLNHGRCRALQVVSIGEALKASSMIGKTQSEIDTAYGKA